MKTKNYLTGLKSNAGSIQYSAHVKKVGKNNWESRRRKVAKFDGALGYSKLDAITHGFDSNKNPSVKNPLVVRIKNMIDRNNAQANLRKILPVKKLKNGWKIIGLGIEVDGSFDDMKHVARENGLTHVKFLSNTIAVK